MIREIQGDVFNCGAEAIIHQANCQCTMGSGIAKTIQEKYPEAYEADCKTVKGDINKLGTFSFAEIFRKIESSHRFDKIERFYIINMYSQFQYGVDKRYTNYEAMVTALEKIKQFCIDENLKKVSCPCLMGCFRGGGNWIIVRAILESIFGNSKIELIICELEKDYSRGFCQK